VPQTILSSHDAAVPHTILSSSVALPTQVKSVDSRRLVPQTSGLAIPSYHDGPRELYPARRSSVRTTVLFVVAAPTVIAEGALPGEAMPAWPVSPLTGLVP
jgi:hypothetical protein